MLHNTNNKIELKRGIRGICNLKLVDKIADLPKFECFYEDIFNAYGVLYDIETIRQKRTFVAAATKYFIIDRLPEGTVSVDADGDYSIKSNSSINDALVDAIDKFYESFNNSSSNDEFKENFAKYYNEEVKDFSKEIAENRDDSLSDFAKVIEKVATYKDDKKSK